MKYTISVEEVLKYDREFVVELPEDMDEDELDGVLDAAQDQANMYQEFDSIYEYLQGYGIKVVERADDDTHYPKDAEFEIYDMVKTGEESEEGSTDDEEDDE